MKIKDTTVFSDPNKMKIVKMEMVTFTSYKARARLGVER